MTYHPFLKDSNVDYRDLNMYISGVEQGFISIDGFSRVLKTKTYFRIGHSGIFIVDLNSMNLRDGLDLHEIIISVDEP